MDMHDRPPPGQVPHEAAVTWSVALVDPLLSTAARLRLDGMLLAAVHADPAWATAFFSGLVSDLTQTLPDEDPWRHLAARLGDLTRGPNPPDSDGASGAGGTTFGSWQDATWPAGEPTLSDPMVDIAYAALAHDPLSRHAAALLAFSVDGWEQTRAVAAAILEVAGPAGLFDAATSAVRWSAFRRRQYEPAGGPDLWPLESAWAWGWRATRIAAGSPWPESDIERDQAYEKVATARRQITESVGLLAARRAQEQAWLDEEPEVDVVALLDEWTDDTGPDDPPEAR